MKFLPMILIVTVSVGWLVACGTGNVLVECACSYTCDGDSGSLPLDDNICEDEDKSSTTIAEEGEKGCMDGLASICVSATCSCSCKKTEDPCEQK